MLMFMRCSKYYIYENQMPKQLARCSYPFIKAGNQNKVQQIYIYVFRCIYLFNIIMPEKLKNTAFFFSLLCSQRHIPTLWGKNRSQKVLYKTYFKLVEELLLTSMAFELKTLWRLYGLPKTTYKVWKQPEGNPVPCLPFPQPLVKLCWPKHGGEGAGGLQRTLTAGAGGRVGDRARWQGKVDDRAVWWQGSVGDRAVWQGTVTGRCGWQGTVTGGPALVGSVWGCRCPSWCQCCPSHVCVAQPLCALGSRAVGLGTSSELCQHAWLTQLPWEMSLRDPGQGKSSV